MLTTQIVEKELYSLVFMCLLLLQIWDMYCFEVILGVIILCHLTEGQVMCRVGFVLQALLWQQDLYRPSKERRACKIYQIFTDRRH